MAWIKSPDIREQTEHLFSRKMLGSVFVGQFVGNLAGAILTGALGLYLGNLIGAFLAVALFIYWDRVARAAKQEQEKLSGQSKLDGY